MKVTLFFFTLLRLILYSMGKGEKEAGSSASAHTYCTHGGGFTPTQHLQIVSDVANTVQPFLAARLLIC